MCIKLVIRNLFFTNLLLLIGVFSFSQLPYTFERLNTEFGLPTNTIKGLQFDETNRFLWIATESGIIRYNGHNVQSFGDQEEKSILNNRVVYFTKAQNGTLFGKFVDATSFKINQNDALVGKKSVKNNDLNEYFVNKYNLNSNIYNSVIYSLNFKTFKIKNDILYIIEDLLLQYANDKIDTLTLLESNLQAFQLGDEIFFINRENELFELNINIKNNITKKYDLKKVTYGESYFKTKSNIKVFQDLFKDEVFLIIDDKLYKVSKFKNNFTFELLLQNLPLNEYYKFVQFDKLTQTIYIGTDNRGVIVCRPKFFERITPNNSILNTSYSSYAQVILKNRNIQVNDGPIFGSNKKKCPIIFNKKSGTSTLLSSKNILYFTNSDGLIEYDINNNKVLKKITKSEFTINNSFIESEGIIYAINDKGVIKKDIQNNWSYVLKFKWTPLNFLVYDIKALNSNEFIIATTDGIYKFNIQNNSFKLFYRDNLKANFRSIFKMEDYFLIGTYGGGVYIYKNDTIKKLPLDPNGYLKFTHCFIKDDNNYIWLSTNKGLFRLPVLTLINFWKYGSESISYRYFGKLDGIDVVEMNGGCSPCAIKLSNGDFSIPGIDGLIQFNPNKLNNFNLLNIKPKVYLDKVIIDGKITNKDYLSKSLSSKSKSIDFQLGISGMLSEENVIVEFKFDINEIWKRVSIKNPIIHLDKTSFGQNKLFLRWRNTASTEFDSIEYPFYVSYPWTLHPFMLIIYFIIIILLIYFYIRIKTSIYKRRQKELELEVNSKTKSLLNLNKYLKERNQAKEQVIAIMNHDVLTPLKYLHITANSINEKIKDIDLKKSIQQIATTSKELEYLTINMLSWVKFDNTNKLSNSQDVDLHKLIHDLIDFITPFTSLKEIYLENKIPKDTIIKNWADALRVLIYNFLMNAIKSTEQGEISVSIENASKGYTIKIRDTGVGMSKSMASYLITGKSRDEVEHLPKYKKGNGVGYQIIRNIIKLMKAKLVIESKEGIGTTVSVVFKI